MNNIKLLFFQFILSFFSCNIEKEVTGNYEFNELLDLVKIENEYYLENQIPTNFSVDTIFTEHKKYRKKMVETLKHRFSNIVFDRAFLIEDFSIRANKVENEKSEFNYGAIVYIEDSLEYKFISVEISWKKNNVQLDVMNLDSEERTKVKKWLLSKLNLEHFETINYYNKSLEQYLVISKLTKDESFCRLILNPLWVNMLKAESSIKYESLHKIIEDVAEIYYLTGKGSPF